MLRRLALRNFRAYRRETFHFSKINVFVGPNNSGKSSALSAINLIAQTVQAREALGGPLELNGQFEQLGTFIDVIHGNRSNTPLGIELDYNRNSLNLEFKYRTQRREIELSKFELYSRGNHVFSYNTKKDSYDLKIGNKTFETLLPNISKRRPSFITFWPFLRQFLSPYKMREEYDKKLSEKIYNEMRERERGLSIAWRDLLFEFRQFDALSPFRDQPQRTYLFTGETPQHVGRTGSNSINLLVNDSARRGSQRIGIAENISRWFQVTGIAKGVKVKSLTSRHFEICVVANDGSEHNICDVGFGCSQVLPVLAGGLNLFMSRAVKRPMRGEPIFVVQEPEIHLHPNAQAALGSFFVGLVKNRGQLFIETHSDTLVLRLARHIALGHIPADALNIFFFSDLSEKKGIHRVRIGEDGSLPHDWPGGFFPQRQSESLALAKAISQDKKPTQPELPFIYFED